MTDRSYPYRVFLSYAKIDYDIAKDLVAELREMDLDVYWDGDISAGTSFYDTIKGFIAYSHIFIALVSHESKERPWVHQETGFAIAKDIPVLIIEISQDESGEEREPGDKNRKELGMIAALQTITVKRSLEDLREKFAGISLERLVMPPASRPTSLINIAQWPEKRTELLVEYANRELQMGNHGTIRQKATFSSFHLPPVDPGDPIWESHDGDQERSKYYRFLLSEERRALEEHARAEGCKLIIDPTLRLHYAGSSAVGARLEGLRQFLQSCPRDRVEVVLSQIARRSNLTIVGNWFVAESYLPGRGGYRHTVFNFHAPTVLMKIKQFDEEFDTLDELNKAERKGKPQVDFAISMVEKEIELLNRDERQGDKKK